MQSWQYHVHSKPCKFERFINYNRKVAFFNNTVLSVYVAYSNMANKSPIKLNSGPITKTNKPRNKIRHDSHYQRQII